MDDSRFDELTRKFGQGWTRRRALKTIAGGVAGLFAGSAAFNVASARTLTICHASGDEATPYESMTIEQTEFNLHARHGDFMRVECCADGECASLAGMCSSGACENGYCVQLPQPAGTACGGDACLEQGSCDGAMTCVDADIPVVCEPIDECHLVDGCDPVTGCVQIANEGASCTPDETHDGVCDAAGICQPILICTAAPTCSENSDCLDGDTCVNGGCFSACANGAYCNADCSDCRCQFKAQGSGHYCLDAGAYIGLCQSDGDCPEGSLCSSYYAGGEYLCTQPCAQKR